MDIKRKVFLKLTLPLAERLKLGRLVYIFEPI